MVFRLLVRLVQHIPLKVIRCNHIDSITPESFTKSRFSCTTCTKTAELQKGMITLTEAAREARREYMRKWREENRQSIREYNRNWRRANRDAMNRYAKEWRDANPDKVKGYRESYWERRAEQTTLEGGAV